MNSIPLRFYLKHRNPRITPRWFRASLVIVSLFVLPHSFAQAAVFETEADAIYGGFWRDLYQFGPVVIDTIGADLGVFQGENIKVGVAFATLVGLLSDDEGDDVFDSIDDSSSQYSEVLNALEPTDFTYSTAALAFEYLFYNGSTFAWSTKLNYGLGVLAYNQDLAEESPIRLKHTYALLGIGFTIKFTENIWWTWGISQREDFDADENNRPEGFENFDAVTIYNHLTLVKF